MVQGFSRGSLCGAACGRGWLPGGADATDGKVVGGGGAADGRAIGVGRLRGGDVADGLVSLPIQPLLLLPHHVVH